MGSLTKVALGSLALRPELSGTPKPRVDPTVGDAVGKKAAGGIADASLGLWPDGRGRELSPRTMHPTSDSTVPALRTRAHTRLFPDQRPFTFTHSSESIRSVERVEAAHKSIRPRRWRSRLPLTLFPGTGGKNKQLLNHLTDSMSSNAPRQQFAQVDLTHGLLRVPSFVRCTAGRGEMAAYWHKSGRKKISSFSYCYTGSAKCCVRTTAKSSKHPEAFHFRRKSNPIVPFEMASGLLQVLSPSVEKCLSWSHVRFHGNGAAC